MKPSNLLVPGSYVRTARRVLLGASRRLPWRLVSYSQNGEDLIIHSLLGRKRRGFYVDVGAFDPFLFSNTAYFYRIGWCGINIEPIEDRYREFTRRRIRDTNLNLGIADSSSTMVLYLFEPATLTTFDREEADRYAAFPGHRIVGTFEVEVRRLRDVLDEFAPNQRIDFLSIDVEGLEHRVLLSNDWERYRPRLIVIESVRYYPTESDVRPSTNSKWEHILFDHGYVRLGDVKHNSFYAPADDVAVREAAGSVWPISARSEPVCDSSVGR